MVFQRDAVFFGMVGAPEMMKPTRSFCSGQSHVKSSVDWPCCNCRIPKMSDFEQVCSHFQSRTMTSYFSMSRMSCSQCRREYWAVPAKGSMILEYVGGGIS